MLYPIELLGLIEEGRYISDPKKACHASALYLHLLQIRAILRWLCPTPLA